MDNKEYFYQYHYDTEESRFYNMMISEKSDENTGEVEYLFPVIENKYKFLENLSDVKLFVKLSDYFLNGFLERMLEEDINEHFTKEQINIIRKAICLYSTVSNNKKYQEVIKKYNWNE